MRNVFVLFATLIAAPAFAQNAPTTLENVTTRGVIMRASGMDIAVRYTSDGRFTAMDGFITGTWRIEGESLCSTNSAEPAEVCVAYPTGKQPGDEFEVVGPRGPLAITINN